MNRNIEIMLVFYADDDAEDREIFCEAIQQINPGIKVILARNGHEALQILQSLEEVPNFIFLDINMPVMSGRECLIKLKSMDRVKVVPVVIYSTTSDQGELRRLILSGAQDYIIKGNSFENVKESIHKVLTKKYSSGIKSLV